MRTIVKGERYRLGGKFSAEYLLTLAATRVFDGLFGHGGGKFGEHLLPRETLTKIRDIGIPLLSPPGGAARSELREDPGHFLAVCQLNGLQVVQQRPQFGRATRRTVGELIDQIQKRQLVRIVQ